MTPGTDQHPDPRTAPDDAEDASNRGRSAEQPAEGADDVFPENEGSPQG